MRSIAAVAVLLLAPSALAQARLALPQQSPAASVTQVLGTTEIAIRYHRPAVRGRVIWGELVPYGALWRAGANDATTISFDGPVNVAGEEVAAGTYALFVIPDKQRWTVVLNAVGEQWGAYAHDAAQDVLRFEVRPVAAPMREFLTYTIEPESGGKAEVRLAWEKLAIAFPIEIDVHAQVERQIEAALAQAGPKDWQVYMQAARYYFDNDLDAKQALAWAQTSVAIEESSWNLEILARLLHRTGAKGKAIAPLEKVIEMVRKTAPAEYVASLERTLAEWKATQ